jgi:hypothetical protein
MDLGEVCIAWAVCRVERKRGVGPGVLKPVDYMAEHGRALYLL